MGHNHLSFFTLSEGSSTADCFTKKSTFFVVVGVLLFLLLFSTTVVGLLFYRLTR